METPEKIYLNKNNKTLLDILSVKDAEHIEYIRTDAFIENACKWIKGNYLKYPNEDCADTAKFVMDF